MGSGGTKLARHEAADAAAARIEDVQLHDGVGGEGKVDARRRVERVGIVRPYHDPNGAWNTYRIRLVTRTAYSEEFAASHNRQPTAEVELLLAPGHGEFHYTKRTGGDLIEISLVDGEGSISVNGSTDVSEAEKERLNLSGPELYQDYGEYIYLMPMKLKDPGTIVAAEPETVEFDGRRVLGVTVTYDPDVGEHAWDFYFDPDTYALVGCRFHIEDPRSDGEYITFEGEIADESSGLRLPKVRAWYYNEDGTHLGTDDITSVGVIGE
jgi:hypothetical protein